MPARSSHALTTPDGSLQAEAKTSPRLVSFRCVDKPYPKGPSIYTLRTLPMRANVKAAPVSFPR
jgi:hypothetical protein